METGRWYKGDRGPTSYALYHLHGIMWVSKGKSKDVFIYLFQSAVVFASFFPEGMPPRSLITGSIWITIHASKSDFCSSLGNRMMG